MGNIRCRMLDAWPTEPPSVGDMWWGDPPADTSTLGADYQDKRLGSHTLWIQLPSTSWPNGSSFCLDWRSYDGNNYGRGWTRTGEPPNVTVTPSIVFDGWHGWVRDGELVNA